MGTTKTIETTPENIALASRLLGARRLADGRYAYRADETGTDWAVSEGDLVQILAFAEGTQRLDNAPYSAWCEATTAQELRSEEV